VGSFGGRKGETREYASVGGGELGGAFSMYGPGEESRNVEFLAEQPHTREEEIEPGAEVSGFIIIEALESQVIPRHSRKIRRVKPTSHHLHPRGISSITLLPLIPHTGSRYRGIEVYVVS